MKPHFVAAAIAPLLLANTACGPGEQAVAPPVRHESPADAIRRVGENWVATQHNKSFRSHPSPITMLEVTTRSMISFPAGKKWSPELLEVTEVIEMRAGGRFVCKARGETRVEYSFGRRDGDPAVEMRRPATRLSRECDPPDYPEPEVELPETAGRFRLKGDQLTPFDPPLEKRVYLPVQ